MSVKFLRVFFLVLIILTASVSEAGWEKYKNNPVLTPTAGEWDSVGTWTISVIKDGETYKAWYGGRGAAEAIGYAASTNGISWSKHNVPVLPLGAGGEFDSGSIHSPCVIKDGSTYKMWYTGGDGGVNDRIGYATSNNGTAWAKLGVVLPLGNQGEWDENGVSTPCVIKDGATYKMWYTGVSAGGGDIGYATSPDGINWNKYAGNPVLEKSGSGWDANMVSWPCVIKDGGTYKMWYTGLGAGWAIGYATSSNGISWKMGKNNPVIERGAPGSWDNLTTFGPCVLKGSWKMWYTGRGPSGTLHIGYATLSGKGRGGYVYRGYYVLDAFGGIHLCDGAPAVKDYPYWEGQDIARDLEFSPDGTGFYVLDAYGGIHNCDGAPPLEDYPYWDDQDVARDLEFNPNGQGFYVLDCYGGIHPRGGAPELKNYPYWPDEDIARGLEIRSDGSFYILDCYGGIHPRNGAPEIENYPYWDGSAMARDLEIDPRLPETGYFVLDNWGGIHAVAAEPLKGYPFWEGQDLARAIAFPR